MRSVGYNPTPEQVESMIKQLDTTNKGYVTFEEFLEVMREREVRKI